MNTYHLRLTQSGDFIGTEVLMEWTILAPDIGRAAKHGEYWARMHLTIDEELVPVSDFDLLGDRQQQRAWSVDGCTLLLTVEVQESE